MEILHRDNWGGMPRMRALALVLIVGSVAAESLPEISDLRMEIQRENRLMTELLDNMDGLGTRLSSRVDALHVDDRGLMRACTCVYIYIYTVICGTGAYRCCCATVCHDQGPGQAACVEDERHRQRPSARVSGECVLRSSCRAVHDGARPPIFYVSIVCTVFPRCFPMPLST